MLQGIAAEVTINTEADVKSHNHRRNKISKTMQVLFKLAILY
jgi:hypothetical protein